MRWGRGGDIYASVQGILYPMFPIGESASRGRLIYGRHGASQICLVGYGKLFSSGHWLPGYWERGEATVAELLITAGTGKNCQELSSANSKSPNGDSRITGKSSGFSPRISEII